MNDRELLEMAAKAAGLKHVDYTGVDYDGRLGIVLVDDIGRYCGEFSPLTDDGDALRLAVQLHLTIYQWSLSECCVCNESGTINESVSYGEDQLAATRRAIVLAAAEIGKGMK